jgi:hypothetical protein
VYIPHLLPPASDNSLTRADRESKAQHRAGTASNCKVAKGAASAPPTLQLQGGQGRSKRTTYSTTTRWPRAQQAHHLYSTTARRLRARQAHRLLSPSVESSSMCGAALSSQSTRGRVSSSVCFSLLPSTSATTGACFQSASILPPSCLRKVRGGVLALFPAHVRPSLHTAVHTARALHNLVSTYTPCISGSSSA